MYTHWRGIDVMFHVSTLLPYEKNDPQEPVSIKINYGFGLVLVYPIIPVKCLTPSPYNSLERISLLLHEGPDLLQTI